jgi:pimeloyl-ACP methyl ester carboxylesterase
MATFLVAHGAWSAAWAWKKVRPLLRAVGHDIFTPTNTGLGERAHQAAPDIGLQTHVEDGLGVLTFEDLRDVVLIGHSDGAMVATVVADRAPERLHLVTCRHPPSDPHDLRAHLDRPGQRRPQEVRGRRERTGHRQRRAQRRHAHAEEVAVIPAIADRVAQSATTRPS